jgi:hypothetical protein
VQRGSRKLNKTCGTAPGGGPTHGVLCVGMEVPRLWESAGGAGYRVEKPYSQIASLSNQGVSRRRRDTRSDLVFPLELNRHSVC